MRQRYDKRKTDPCMYKILLCMAPMEVRALGCSVHCTSGNVTEKSNYDVKPKNINTD